MNAPAWILAELSPPASDVIFVGLTLAFFAFAVAYAWFCENVR